MREEHSEADIALLADDIGEQLELPFIEYMFYDSEFELFEDGDDDDFVEPDPEHEDGNAEIGRDCNDGLLLTT